VINEQLLRCVD